MPAVLEPLPYNRIIELFHDQSPRRNVVGHEDRTRDRPHTRQARI